MKGTMHILSVFLTGFLLLAGCLWLLNTAQAARPSSPQFHLPPSGKIEPKYILVDDFKDGDWQNELGKPNGCYAEKGGSISCDITATVQHSYVGMTYNVTPESSYAWFQMDLGNIDLSALDSVWIVIKGEHGGEEVYAEFKDCNDPANYPKVKISDYLSGSISSYWRAAAIPFEAFNQVPGWSWSCIDRLNILAHNQISNGSGKVYVDDVRLLPATVLVDDFHDPEFENELGGSSGPWFNAPVVVTTTFPNDVLKLSYDVPSGDFGGGYWTKLISTNLLSQKDYLSFDIRGEQGGEEVAAEFKDCGANGYTHYPEIKVSDYLEGGISTDWRTVAIPLAAFVEVQTDTDEGVNWKCIDQGTFNVSGRFQYNSGQGTVYIDDVKLVPASALPYRLPLLVDRFHDCNDRNALNWGWYTQTMGAATFTAIPDAVNRRGNYGCGYRFTFDVKVEQSGWAWTELKGLDVTDYSYLEFYIKGKEGLEATRVYLRDRAGHEKIEVVEATRDWQQVMIPLSYFTPIVDLTDLSELKFAYEVGYRKGEVYVDDISFMQPHLFLPIVLKDYRESCFDKLPSCSPPYNSYEPNNFRCSTTFALSSGVPIQSYICAPDDIDDYYYIDVTHLNPITARLTNIPRGMDYDLYLYYGDSLVAESNKYGNADEELHYTPTQTGRYYLRVYPYSGHSLNPYTLWASFQ
jgi:hypothetical protein